MTEQPQWLADLQRRGEEMVRQSRQAQEELAELAETAASADRMVTVTVGANGALRQLTIDDRAMRRSGAELAATITQLAGRAQAAAARRAVRVVEPFAGEEGMEFLRSQLPPEDDEDGGAEQGSARGRDRRDDDDDPPQSFLRPAH
ncbi:hypothetical protein SacmaDRAFT_3298 [Saccharomonospora marina XMU15]|uniref:YbaB/EbfC DNA-binding family protein n=1 Tax=Saccharomonospora marina XMU15 TaxID=882083 RepID=H5XAL8_9PSEU|nr:YbaB/EbfC family nucleoid-associated protein [Saccharomonospora marina]EHR51523.1 hypothetical protein SacmaDRAFT_3298 [Saccharomonospora marina XMU15]